MSSSLPAGPAAPALWLLFLATYRASYEAANIGQPAAPAGLSSAPPNSPGAPLSPAEQEWARQAVRRYAQAQERKWRRWREAMFEPAGAATSQGQGPKLKQS